MGDAPAWRAEGLLFENCNCALLCRAHLSYKNLCDSERCLFQWGIRFEDGACVFLQDGLCRVHEAKPIQCGTWPFWEENLNSPQAWEDEVASFSPGAGKGPLISAEQIRIAIKKTDGAADLK